MKGRANTRALIWGVVAMVIAAAFLLAHVSRGVAVEEKPLDMAAPVSAAQCAPCHLNLGSVDIPGVTFSHGNHLLISCDACHSRMPHRGGAAERIPMEVCFACHGVQHGPRGELATAACEDCHTPEFDLRPANHSKDWAKEPHARVAQGSGVNACMMCHVAAEDCDTCHEEQAPEAGPMPEVYHPVVIERPKGPSITVDTNGGVTMSQCAFCHFDIDDIAPGRVIFSHSEHLARNYQCEACHPKFPHSASGTVKPDMLSCYRCHGLQHAVQGKVAPEECDDCHPKEFDLVPRNHTSKFIKGEHSKRANSEPEYCAMCHASNFCIACHTGEKVSANAPGKAVIPDDHRRAEWKFEHGPLYLDGKGACASCHTQKSCSECHQTPMPHPVGWLSNHKPAKGISNDDCNVCHTDRATCQSCHHDAVRQAELIAENCTPCHDEMKQTPATGIKIKGFAEHAVHFNVAEQTGEPYTCDDCHIGFSTSASSQNHQGSSGTDALAEAGHDVRLCYGCHGALDLQNRQIAPWPGVSLCIRCHTDINV